MTGVGAPQPWLNDAVHLTGRAGDHCGSLHLVIGVIRNGGVEPPDEQLGLLGRHVSEPVGALRALNEGLKVLDRHKDEPGLAALGDDHRRPGGVMADRGDVPCKIGQGVGLHAHLSTYP